MSPFDWTSKQLGLFWLGAAAVAVTLFAVATLVSSRPWKFFWLLPYPIRLRTTLAVAWAVIREFFSRSPLEATALLVIPALAIFITVLWAVGRIWR